MKIASLNRLSACLLYRSTSAIINKIKRIEISYLIAHPFIFNVRQIFDRWKALAFLHNKTDMEAIPTAPESTTNERKLLDAIKTQLDIVSASRSVKNSMNAECLRVCGLTTVLESE